MNKKLKVSERPVIYLRLEPELFSEVETLAGKEKIKSLNKFMNLFLKQTLAIKKTAKSL